VEIVEQDELFRDLYDRYYRIVLAMLVRRGFVREDAMELAQETFIRVYQGLNQYRGDSEWGYIQKTARNIAFNEVRSRQSSKRSAVEISLDSMPSLYDNWQSSSVKGQPKSPDMELLEKEQMRLLFEGIGDLPPGMRRCLLLRLEGLKYREISEVMGVSLDAVKSRLNEAQNILRKRLRK
jgi:RNA polymerase sigma-70 factor, ECF subfamily